MKISITNFNLDSGLTVRETLDLIEKGLQPYVRQFNIKLNPDKLVAFSSGEISRLCIKCERTVYHTTEIVVLVFNRPIIEGDSDD